MSLYFKYSATFADGQQIGFGFKLPVISFGCPRETLTKGAPCSCYNPVPPCLSCPRPSSALLLLQSMRRCSVPSALTALGGAIRRWQRSAKCLTPAMVT